MVTEPGTQTPPSFTTRYTSPGGWVTVGKGDVVLVTPESGSYLPFPLASFNRSRRCTLRSRPRGSVPTPPPFLCSGSQPDSNTDEVTCLILEVL